MKFKHLSKEEAEKGNLMEAGIYKFTVLDAEDQISKAGSEMIKLTLRVQDSEGTIHTVYDYLLEKLAYKLRHFCEHTGLLGRYEADELTAADCLDKSGICEIIVQEGQQKYDGSKYADKNAVKDYVENKVSMSKDPVPAVTGHPAFDDQDIPFNFGKQNMIFKDDDGDTVIEISRVDCCFFKLCASRTEDNSSVTIIMNAHLMRDALLQLGFISEGFHEADGRGEARH